MIIKGKKVILRPVRLDDAKRFVQWFNDPEVNLFLRIREMNIAAEKKWIRQRTEGKVKNEHNFSIDTSEGVHIGSTGFTIVERRNHNAEFGIMIGNKNFWNKGYGTDATKAMLRYGFDHLKLHRVYLDVYAYNTRAIKVYKQLGFKREGVKRDQIYYQDKYHDVYYMGLLKQEWKGY